MAELIVDKKSTGWKLFNWRFIVLIPAAHIYNEDYIKVFGTSTTMNRALDMQLAEETRPVPCTVNDIVEFLYKGVDVTFVDPIRSVDAYELIEEHLEGIAKFLRAQTYSAVIGEEHEARQKRLMEDVKKLIHAANRLFPTARRNTKTESNTTDLFAFLNDVLGIPTAPRLGFTTVGNKIKFTENDYDANQAFEQKLCTNTSRRLQQWRED